MLIVGGAAAFTAIAVYLAIIAIKSLRHSWSARRTERLIARRDDDHAQRARREQAAPVIARRDDNHAALRVREPRAGANLSR